MTRSGRVRRHRPRPAAAGGNLLWRASNAGTGPRPADRGGPLLALDLAVVARLAHALMVRRIDEQRPLAAMRPAMVDHRRRHDLAAGAVPLAQRRAGELRLPSERPGPQAVPRPPGRIPAALDIMGAVALAPGLLRRAPARRAVRGRTGRHGSPPPDADRPPRSARDRPRCRCTAGRW